jgi:hypothetical protein
MHGRSATGVRPAIGAMSGAGLDLTAHRPVTKSTARRDGTHESRGLLELLQLPGPEIISRPPHIIAAAASAAAHGRSDCRGSGPRT